MGWSNKDWAISNCNTAIQNVFDKLIEKYNLPEEEVKVIADDLEIDISSEIEDIEDDTTVLSDFENEEMEDHLKSEGYFVFRVGSLKEEYKIEAFIEKLKNDPYGPMIIL